MDFCVVLILNRLRRSSILSRNEACPENESELNGKQRQLSTQMITMTRIWKVNDKNKLKVDNINRNDNQANWETNKNQPNSWKQKIIMEDEERNVYPNDVAESKINHANPTKQGIYVLLFLLLVSYNEFSKIRTNGCSRGD